MVAYLTFERKVTNIVKIQTRETFHDMTPLLF